MSRVIDQPWYWNLATGLSCLGFFVIGITLLEGHSLDSGWFHWIVGVYLIANIAIVLHILKDD